MLETSQDILHWALAIGSITALLSLAYLLMYTGLIVRQIFKMMTTVEGAFQAIKNIFEKIGEKIADTSQIGKFAVDVVKVVSDMHGIQREFSEKKNAKKQTKRKTTKKSSK